MSYHNGSVWPHDNALIGSGMARYGLEDAVVRVFSGLFDAAIFMELHRLPELFCGFARRSGEGPTLYPVACSPQAWSTASVFMLLGACLRLSITASPPDPLHPCLPARIRSRAPDQESSSGELFCRSFDISLQRKRRCEHFAAGRRRGDSLLQMITKYSALRRQRIAVSAASHI